MNKRSIEYYSREWKNTNNIINKFLPVHQQHAYFHVLNGDEMCSRHVRPYPKSVGEQASEMWSWVLLNDINVSESEIKSIADNYFRMFTIIWTKM